MKSFQVEFDNCFLFLVNRFQHLKIQSLLEALEGHVHTRKCVKHFPSLGIINAKAALKAKNRKNGPIDFAQHTFICIQKGFVSFIYFEPFPSFSGFSELYLFFFSFSSLPTSPRFMMRIAHIFGVFTFYTFW